MKMRRRGTKPIVNLSSASCQGNVPPNIDVVFRDDYDILYVDSIIRQKFVLERLYRLPELKSSLEEMQDSILLPMTIAQRERTESEIRLLQEEISIVISRSREKNYVLRTNSLVNRYQDDFIHVHESIFTGIMEETKTKENKNLVNLIYSYLQIASEYIKINIVHIRPPQEALCYNCLTPLNESQCNSFLRVCCFVCGAEQVSATLTKDTKDVGSSSSRHKEDDTIDNFLKTWTQKQGKEIIDVPATVYQKLDLYFSSRGIPTGAQVKLLPLNKENKKRGNTNHDMLHDALKAIKEPDYYKNMDYIGREYFGWENYDYEYLREIVISDYLETQAVFLSLDVSFRNRQSSPGTQFRLRKHLQMRGFPIPQSEFKIAKNVQSKRDHERVWKIMVERSGNPEHHYIED
jgi:hypothetical protein